MALGKNKNAPQFGSTSKIRIAQSTYQQAILKKIVVQILLVCLVAVFIYVIFAATLVRAIITSEGPMLIKNNTFSGGQVPAGEVVLISTNADQGEGYLDRIEQSFIPQSNTALVQVLAGPAGSVEWSPNGTLKVSNKELPIKFPNDPGKEILNYEYIAVCLEGDCFAGEPMIFGEKRIYGVPLSNDDLGGLEIKEFKEKAGGTTEARPIPPELLVYSKFANKDYSELGHQCYAELIYNSPLPDGTLRYMVDSIVEGKAPTLRIEDRSVLSDVNRSKEAAACAEK